LSTSEPKGRRERRKARTRQALLDAAMALFRDHGIYGTRIEDITERADLGKGAFYNYFDSKDAIVAALLADAVDRLERDYLSRTVAHGAIAERIASLVSEHQLFFDEHPHYALLFHQARGLLQVRSGGNERMREVFADYLDRLGRRLPGASDDGNGWTAEERLDIAAALAGGIAGYRSFRVAAGLIPKPETARDSLAAGLSFLIDRRRGASA
jgi:AcrR family transcriptional regulator